MLTLPIHQIDAFAERPFSGNPAAVVPLRSWLDDAVLQAIAMENNLAETAFIVPDGETWLIRWFTPTCEVALCGHATLASAYVICHVLAPGAQGCVFKTREAGRLTVTRDGDLFELDFPAIAIAPPSTAPDVAALIGARPQAVLYGAYSATEGDYVAVFATWREVAALTPDLRAMSALGPRGVICTAPGDDVDFVSRYFAPGAGIDEDPVTGSAHCLLTPYWAERLARPTLTARQISARGGYLRCRHDGARVRIAGKAVPYLKGTISLHDAR